MSSLRIFGLAMVLFIFSAFKPTSACEYAGSNINFVKTQTEKALDKDELKLIRYYSYKALNAIEKSKKQMNACKCEFASIGMEESAYLLKRAVKLNDVRNVKDLLKRALTNTVSSIDALKIHDVEHTRKKTNKLLALNDANEEEEEKASLQVEKPLSYQEKIDSSLDKYRISLDKVVRTVNCAEARAFAERIFKNAEQELLKEGLSEPKKYLNLRTQEITAEALVKLTNKCGSYN